MPYLLIFFLAVLWLIAEFSRAETSRGFITSTLGCTIFSVGIIGNSVGWDKPFCGLMIAIGMFAALFGAARFIVYELRQ
jgi:small-conductance mechanosensitive channel